MIPDKTEDAILAETLRREEPDQFYTLVRMHLSFILDLNTDEFDSNAEKTKFRPLKWGFPKKNKAKESTETTSLTAEALERVFKLIEWLSEERNVTQEGIFRRSGKLTRQHELRNLLNSREPLVLNDGRFSVHDGASVLKNVLAQLPECLLTEAHYPAHCQIAELCQSSGGKISEGEEKRLLRALQLMLLLLPVENVSLLRHIMKLLHLTASHVAENKMSADNLATLFTPHLLCPRRLTPEALHTNSQILSPVLSFMIMQGPTLFEVPSELATDIRANWARQEKGLNESVCDGMAAKTVFTFVDRERTAEASAATNPTEDALAQLYAHIQSLPESSSKKRLIKNFNKQNGQGTPQLLEKDVRMSRSRQCNSGAGSRPRARSRSLGDSIKKHIPVFNKAPKRRKDSTELQAAKECRESPVPRKKSLTDSSSSEDLSSAVTGSGGTTMPPLKNSLLKLSTSGGESPSRVRLVAHPKRTPLSVLTQNTLGNSSRDSPGLALAEDCKARRKSPCPTPFSIPPAPAPDQAPVPLKPQQGGDVIWPETMMTPRSRKPVVALSSSNLCQLAHLSGWAASDTGELLRSATSRATLLSDNSRKLTRKLAMMHEESFAEAQNPLADIGADRSNSSSGKVRDLCHTSAKDDPHTDIRQSKICKCGNTCDKLSIDDLSCSGESTSITGTFREYLMSRSVLTASPVDLSFSSRTGDFDTSSDREMKMLLSGDAMSDSLLYCLDGNRPEKTPSDSLKSNDDRVEVTEDKSGQDGNLCNESQSSGVETGTCFGSGTISIAHSLNTGTDSINNSSFTDKSLEHCGSDDAKITKDRVSDLVNDSYPFQSVCGDHLINNIEVDEFDGCLTNVSASLV